MSLLYRVTLWLQLTYIKVLITLSEHVFFKGFQLLFMILCES